MIVVWSAWYLFSDICQFSQAVFWIFLLDFLITSVVDLWKVYSIIFDEKA